MQEEAILAMDCQAIQETLTEFRGEIARLDESSRQHLEVCPKCREFAAAEHALGLIFEEAVPPADPKIEAAVLAALRPVRVRRRIVAFFPASSAEIVVFSSSAPAGGAAPVSASTAMDNAAARRSMVAALPPIMG